MRTARTDLLTLSLGAPTIEALRAQAAASGMNNTAFVRHLILGSAEDSASDDRAQR